MTDFRFALWKTLKDNKVWLLTFKGVTCLRKTKIAIKLLSQLFLLFFSSQDLSNGYRQMNVLILMFTNISCNIKKKNNLKPAATLANVRFIT